MLRFSVPRRPGCPKTQLRPLARMAHSATAVVGSAPTAAPSDPPITNPKMRVKGRGSPSPLSTLVGNRNPPVTSSRPGRRIIIASDGTGKSSTRGAPAVSSNVSRFLRALTPSCPETGLHQISLYQSGVGTGTLGKLLLSPLTGGAGLGLDDHVLDAYMFIANNHIPGDEISLFGFSRGAFTVRVLAGLIRTLGLFRKEYLWELKRAYTSYRAGKEDFAAYVKDLHSQYKRTRTRHVKIKCVGCWDTVGSMGLPGYDWVKWGGWNQAFDFYDPKLTIGVENAFHALAVDEMRHPFSPTLWHLPKDAKTGQIDTNINLRQAWFPGVHTNVGGGYADTNLADLTLAWMVDKCRPFLAFNKSYVDLCVKLNRNPKAIKSSLREKAGFDKEYRGWAMGRMYESYKGISKWLWHKVRTPGEYCREESDGGMDCVTGEVVHRSVRERWERDSKWRPRSLQGFELEQYEGKWRWIKRKGHSTGAGGKDVVLLEEDFTENKETFEYKLRYGA